MINNISVVVSKKIIIIGKFGSVYGINGWIKLFSYTEKPKNIFTYKLHFINRLNQLRLFIIKEWKAYKNNFIIKINNFDTRCESKKLTNLNIVIYNSQLPLLKNNEYYYKDLLKCLVMNLNRKILGIVINVIETKIHAILVLETRNKDMNPNKRILIPFVFDQIVKKIDLKANIIKVNWDV